MKIIPSIWASVVKLCQAEVQIQAAAYPGVPIEFIDWESHANINELPNKDLIGPTAMAIQEVSPEMFEVNFSVAVSTYSSDRNLFRHRAYISSIFEKLRPLKQVKVYDSETGLETRYMVVTDGTLLAPMSRADARPWQYVQVSTLLEPESD